MDDSFLLIYGPVRIYNSQFCLNFTVDSTETADNEQIGRMLNGALNNKSQ